MKYYSTFKTWDGGYMTSEWTADEYFNYQLVVLLFLGCAAALFSTVVSALLLIFALVDFEEDGPKASIVGLLFGGYFLLDMHFHLIIWFFLMLIENQYMLHLFINMNIIYLISHAFVVFLGGTVYYNVPDVAKRKSTLVMSTLVVFMISFLVVNAVNQYVPIPKAPETREQREERISGGNFKTQQERDDYFKKMQKEYGNL